MHTFQKFFLTLTTLAFLAACGIEETKVNPPATTTVADAGTTTTTTTTPDAGTTTTTTPADVYTPTDVVRIVGADVLFNSTYLRGESSGKVRGDFDATNWGFCSSDSQVNSVQPGWLTVPVGKLTNGNLAVGTSKSYRFTLFSIACGANDWADFRAANASAMTNKHCLEETSQGRNVKIKVTRTDAATYKVECDGTIP